jgi:hypothetical protein
MGCDIHCTYEIQQPNGEWIHHDYRARHEREGSTNYDTLFDDPLYVSRCYRFFAFLADVRNGSGFAGCDTGDMVTPIDDPRGVHDDATDYFKARVFEYGQDGHSHSWFTGEELRDADWDQVTTERAFIRLSNYPTFKEAGKPKGLAYCGGISGANVVHISMEEADDLTEHPEKQQEGKDYFVKIQWALPLREELAYYHDTWLPAVLALHEDPTKVRVSFFFDN